MRLDSCLLMALLLVQVPTEISHAQEPPLNGPRWVKPVDSAISGNGLFTRPETTAHILQTVWVSAHLAGGMHEGFRDLEVSFTGHNHIQWSPFRSSHPPEFTFHGHWRLEANGELDIIGSYQPANGASGLPIALAREKPFHYVVHTVLLEASSDPTYSHTLSFEVSKASE